MASFCARQAQTMLKVRPFVQVANAVHALALRPCIRNSISVPPLPLPALCHCLLFYPLRKYTQYVAIVAGLLTHLLSPPSTCPARSCSTDPGLAAPAARTKVWGCSVSSLPGLCRRLVAARRASRGWGCWWWGGRPLRPGAREKCFSGGRLELRNAMGEWRCIMGLACLWGRGGVQLRARSCGAWMSGVRD